MTDCNGLPLGLSGGLVGPGFSSASITTAVVPGPTISSSRLDSGVIPATSGSARVGRSVPAVAATTVGVAIGLRLGAAHLAVAVLGAVGALDTAPVLGLGAFTAHVTLGVAVTAALDTRLGALRAVVARLKAIEAGATSAAAASTRLDGLGTLVLAVTRRWSVIVVQSSIYMQDSPFVTAVKASLAATARATLRTARLAVTDFTALEAGLVASTSTTRIK